MTPDINVGAQWRFRGTLAAVADGPHNVRLAASRNLRSRCHRFDTCCARPAGLVPPRESARGAGPEVFSGPGGRSASGEVSVVGAADACGPRARRRRSLRNRPQGRCRVAPVGSRGRPCGAHTSSPLSWSMFDATSTTRVRGRLHSYECSSAPKNRSCMLSRRGSPLAWPVCHPSCQWREIDVGEHQAPAPGVPVPGRQVRRTWGPRHGL